MARTALARAQKDTQDAFMRYTACMETERLARQAVSASEKHRDDVSKLQSFPHARADNLTSFFSGRVVDNEPAWCRCEGLFYLYLLWAKMLQASSHDTRQYPWMITSLWHDITSR